MDDKQIIKEIILANLKNNGYINKTEKDLITTIDTLYKNPFDTIEAKTTICRNNVEYPDIPLKLSLTFHQSLNAHLPHASENELKATLLFHIKHLCMIDGIHIFNNNTTNSSE